MNDEIFLQKFVHIVKVMDEVLRSYIIETENDLREIAEEDPKYWGLANYCYLFDPEEKELSFGVVTLYASSACWGVPFRAYFPEELEALGFKNIRENGSIKVTTQFAYDCVVAIGRRALLSRNFSDEY